MQRFAALDGYRAIAALLVVTTHVNFSTGHVTSQPWGLAFARFDIGVAIFFLLSGFLLYRRWSLSAMTAAPAPRTRTYLRRRFWRVMPAFWVVCLVVFLFLPIAEVTPARILSNLTLAQVYNSEWPLLGLTQMWSLAIEVVFYLFLPLVGWLVARRGRGSPDQSMRWQLLVIGALIFIGIAFTILRTFGPLAGQLGSGFWLPAFFDWFGIGMFIGLVQARLTLPAPPVWMQRLQQLAADTTACLLVAGGLFLIAATPIAGTYTLLGSEPTGEMIRHFLYPITALAFLLPGFLASDKQSQWQRFLTSPVMLFLGTISYGMFLWHLFVRDFIAYYLGIRDFSGGFLWMLPTTILVTIGIAYLSWILIERPLINYSHGPSVWSRWRRKNSGPTTPTTATNREETTSTA